MVSTMLGHMFDWFDGDLSTILPHLRVKVLHLTKKPILNGNPTPIAAQTLDRKPSII